MPRTHVVFYRDDDGIAAVYDALGALHASGQEKAFAKLQVRIVRLAEQGHELRRPEADYLRDGIYELRATHRGVNYRILYFFHGRKTAALSHLITKEAEVPDREINRAQRFKRKFAADPDTRTFRI